MAAGRRDEKGDEKRETRGWLWGGERSELTDEELVERLKEYGKVGIFRVSNVKVYIFTCNECGKTIASFNRRQLLTNVMRHILKHKE